MAAKKISIPKDKPFDFEDELVKEDEEEANGILHTITRQCKCGNEFDITPAEQKFYSKKGYELPKRCPECRKKRKEVIVLKCCDCNAPFTITADEKDYFERNHIFIPKRCPACREIKRNRNKENNE